MHADWLLLVSAHSEMRGRETEARGRAWHIRQMKAVEEKREARGRNCS